MIVSTEAAGFGSGYCLDRPHSTGAAEVKRRSVMMGSSAPLLFRDARGCEPGLIVGQSVADGHQGRPLTLRAALPARETVHIPSNCRSEGSVCSARRGVRGQEGQRACPLGCQVSFNERVQWACLVRVRAWARTRQRRTAEGRERRNDGVQQRSRDADVFVVGERSGCVGRWKFEVGWAYTGGGGGSDSDNNGDGDGDGDGEKVSDLARTTMQRQPGGIGVSETTARPQPPTCSYIHIPQTAQLGSPLPC
jgi:hypothetical protein